MFVELIKQEKKKRNYAISEKGNLLFGFEKRKYQPERHTLQVEEKVEEEEDNFLGEERLEEAREREMEGGGGR